MSPETGLTIGRTGDVEVDDNPYLHRTFLVVSFENGFWWISNTGSTLTATVADEQGLFQAWLNPGAKIPLAMKKFIVWFTAGPTTYDFEIHVASPAFTVRDRRRPADGPAEADDELGAATVGRVSFTPDQKLLSSRSASRSCGAVTRVRARSRRPRPRPPTARLDPHPLQPQARQRLPEARRCRHARPARRRRQARDQPQGAARRARALDPARHRGRPRPPRRRRSPPTPRPMKRTGSTTAWPSPNRGTHEHRRHQATGRGHLHRRRRPRREPARLARHPQRRRDRPQGRPQRRRHLGDQRRAGPLRPHQQAGRAARRRHAVATARPARASTCSRTARRSSATRKASNQLVPINPADGTLAPDQSIAVPKPSTATGNRVFTAPLVDLRGGTIAMIDPAKGRSGAARRHPRPASPASTASRPRPSRSPRSAVTPRSRSASTARCTPCPPTTGTITVLRPRGRRFAAPVTTKLGFTSEVGTGHRRRRPLGRLRLRHRQALLRRPLGAPAALGRQRRARQPGLRRAAAARPRRGVASSSRTRPQLTQVPLTGDSPTAGGVKLSQARAGPAARSSPRRCASGAASTRRGPAPPRSTTAATAGQPTDAADRRPRGD